MGRSDRRLRLQEHPVLDRGNPRGRQDVALQRAVHRPRRLERGRWSGEPRQNLGCHQDWRWRGSLLRPGKDGGYEKQARLHRHQRRLLHGSRNQGPLAARKQPHGNAVHDQPPARRQPCGSRVSAGGRRSGRHRSGAGLAGRHADDHLVRHEQAHSQATCRPQGQPDLRELSVPWHRERRCAGRSGPGPLPGRRDAPVRRHRRSEHPRRGHDRGGKSPEPSGRFTGPVVSRGPDPGRCGRGVLAQVSRSLWPEQRARAAGVSDAAGRGFRRSDLIHVDPDLDADRPLDLLQRLRHHDAALAGRKQPGLRRQR